ncbi:hypothetical protein DB30_07135 [Enhygromyxa salina]|uniref:Glycosyltransferase RgtA/B/C/D-like domain-containing protein n=1 Tax=Enhygromyxa salina TaxID=215803 RepID=A0A0C1ZMX7_9BACT|nr:hypothetical protein [Enhygromyxa salina]KIG18799.1 hypothetical protein DB30_07135 [Enhygromyxa salina]
MSLSPSTSVATPRWQLAALLGAVALVLLAAFPYFEQVRNANELPRLLQAMSLVEHGEWAIDGPSRRGIPTGPDVARSPIDDRLYPNKPPGASVVGAVAYVIARLGAEPPTLREFTWWARLLAGVVPVLIIVGLAWGRLRQSYSAPVSAAAISLFVFGTPMFVYARLFYGHALAACLLYAGVLALERGVERGSSRVVGVGAVLASAAITVEYGAAFAGLPIALMFVWPILRDRRVRAARRSGTTLAAIALGCALVPVIALSIYQRAAFGSAWATGYHHAADPGFAQLHGQGLLGLGAPRWSNVLTHLLSPNTGLLVWSPLVVIACVGLGALAWRPGPTRREARLHLAIFVVVVFVGLGLSFEGGWRVGPRYLVVALPMLILGIAEYIAWGLELDSARRRGVAIGLLGAAASWSLIANSLAATLWPHLDPTNIAEPFGAVLLPLWRDGFGPYGIPTWFRGGLTFTLALPIAVGLGGLGWALLRGHERPRAALLLSFALGAGLGALVPTVAIPRSVQAHPKTERNLNYIEKVYEPRVHAGKRTPGRSKDLASPT